MAWDTIIPLTHDYRDDDRPTVSLVCAASIEHNPEIAVRLSPHILRFLDVVPGAKVHIQRGYGDDDGWIRIWKDARPAKERRDFTVRSQKRGRSWVGFAAWPQCGKKAQRAQPADWEPDGKNAIKIKLPAWATRDTAFREEPAAKAVPAVRGLIGGNGLLERH